MVYFLIPNQLGSIDIIGELYTEAGYRTGKLGYKIMVVPPEKMDGYHVNIRPVGEDTSALEPYSITPANPVRIWG